MSPSRASASAGRQPSAPTIGAVSAGNGQVTVNFTASSYLGKPTATTYRAIAYNTSNAATGQSATGAGTPITVTGLSNGTTYKFAVRLEGVATSLESGFSSNVAPVAPPPVFTPPPPVFTPPPPVFTPPPPVFTPPPPVFTPPPSFSSGTCRPACTGGTFCQGNICIG